MFVKQSVIPREKVLLKGQLAASASLLSWSTRQSRDSAEGLERGEWWGSQPKGHPSPAPFLTEREDTQLAIIQSNIQRVTVLTFASGLPDSLAQHFKLHYFGKEANKKKLYFFPRHCLKQKALLKTEMTNVIADTHSPGDSSEMHRQMHATGPCAWSRLQFPIYHPQHFQDREFFF